MEFESYDKLNPWNLNFKSPETEMGYRKAFYEQSALSIKAAIVIGFIIQSLYFLVDKHLLIGNYQFFWEIRGYMILPAIVLLFIFSFFRFFSNTYQILISIGLLVNGVSMAIGIIFYGENYVMYFAGNIVMIAMFSYFMLAIRFIIAAATTWIFSFLAIISLSFIQISFDKYLYAVQLIVTSCGILTVAAYSTERYSRMSYIRSMQLLSSEMKRNEEERARISWLENMADFLRHELRNTVTGIKTSLELFKRKHQGTKDSQYLERAENCAQRIGNLLESVGDATSIESSFMKEELEVVEVSQMVYDQVQQYSLLFPNNKFIFKTEKQHILILGNESRMAQLLDNLVNNAVDHTQGDYPIVISLFVNNENCILSVANRGVPLPDDKDSIFDLFSSFRKDNNQDVKRGYGLYIVKLIAERFGGKVMAKDSDNRAGVEFIVTLPMLKSPSV